MIATLIGLAIGLAIGTLIGAIILRAAVALFNKMAGEASVTEPELKVAMAITFVTTLANLLAGFVIGALFPSGSSQGDGVVVALLFSLPTSFLIMAGMLTLMLPTSFGKACLVTLCHILIALLVFGIVGIIVMMVGGSF
ncbi:MAG: hypothetical protein ACI8W8_003379 [Rhodothermales bacterium]|jgi:hypothetical protein